MNVEAFKIKYDSFFLTILKVFFLIEKHVFLFQFLLVKIICNAKMNQEK